MKERLANFFNILSIPFFYIVCILPILGGGTLSYSNKKLEVGSTDAWFLAALLFAWLAYLFAKKDIYVLEKVNKIVSFLVDMSNRRNLSLLISFVGIIIFLVHAIKFLNLGTHGYDMAYVNRALIHIYKEGRILSCEVCKNGTYLGDHLSYTFLIPALLNSLFQSDLFIFLFEVVVVFGAIWLLLVKGPMENGSQYWILAFIIIVCNRSLRASLVWDFREDHLAFLFISMMLLGLYHKKIVLYFSMLILALLTKEHVGLITMTIPIIIYTLPDYSKLEKKIISIFTIIISLGWLIVAFKYLIPFYNLGIESRNNIVLRFGEYGRTPKDIILNVLTTPSLQWKLISSTLFKMINVKYLFLMLIPYMIFLRKAWIWALPAAVPMLLNIISPLPNEKMMIFHYDLVALPFLIFAVILGMKRGLSEKNISQKLHWALVLAVGFSGRWPLYYVKNLEMENFKASYSLNMLPKNRSYVVNMHLWSQVTHADNVTRLNESKEIESCGNDLVCFKKKMSKYGVEKWFILDTKVTYEQYIYNMLQTIGYTATPLGNQNRVKLMNYER